jgi:hypothetical protein
VSAQAVPAAVAATRSAASRWSGGGRRAGTVAARGRACGWRVGVVETVGLAPRVGVDGETMAVLVEAVDEGDDAGGAGEDGAPLLEGEVGGDDRGALLVAAADDVVGRHRVSM